MPAKKLRYLAMQLHLAATHSFSPTEGSVTARAAATGGGFLAPLLNLSLAFFGEDLLLDAPSFPLPTLNLVEMGRRRLVKFGLGLSTD